jgi:hypothetical protein
MVHTPGAVGSSPTGAIRDLKVLILKTHFSAVAQWQSTVKHSGHNFVDRVFWNWCRVDYDRKVRHSAAGSEYMANDRKGLAGSSPVPSAGNIRTGALATTSLRDFFDLSLSNCTPMWTTQQRPRTGGRLVLACANQCRLLGPQLPGVIIEQGNQNHEHCSTGLHAAEQRSDLGSCNAGYALVSKTSWVRRLIVPLLE